MADGAAVAAWTGARLRTWVGRSLSQIRVSDVSLVLDFWELDDDYYAWIYADMLYVRDSTEGPMHQLRRDSADALVALHALLGGEVAALDVSRGRLRIAFAQGHEVLVDPVLDDQAWALSFEAGGSITCAADGKVDVRMP